MRIKYPIANIMGWVRMIRLSTDYFANFPKLVDKINKEEVLSAAQATLKSEQSVTAILLPEIGGKK